MKRGLMLSLVVLMVALFGMAYAEAPVIGSIPDIIVGDEEGNLTEDLNIFEFMNAISDISTRVTDDYTAPADIQWTFIESDAGTPSADYSINGKYSGDPNITNVGGTLNTSIDVINQTLSPGGSAGAPFADPPVVGGDNTIRQITFFATDLSLTASETIEIKSVDGSFDVANGPVAETTFDFATGAQGWGFKPIGTPPFGSPTGTSNTGALTITSSSTANYYAPWESDIDAIIYDGSAVYRATWDVTPSGQANPALQPGMRTMFNTSSYVDNVEQLILGSATANVGMPSANFTYQQYFAVSDLTELIGLQGTDFYAGGFRDLAGIYLAFEIMNLNGSGTITLNDVTIDKFSASPAGTTLYTYDANFATDWTVEISYPTTYAACTNTNTGTGISLTSGLIASPSLGGLYHGGIRTDGPEGGVERVTMNAGNFYRARFNVSTTVSTPAIVPSFRMRMFDQDQRQSVVRQLTGQPSVAGASTAVAFTSHMPTATAKPYDVYFSPVTDLPAGSDGLGLAFELTDFSPTQAGMVTLESVSIDEIVAIP